jgi:hypothetical protein
MQTRRPPVLSLCELRAFRVQRLIIGKLASTRNGVTH